MDTIAVIGWLLIPVGLAIAGIFGYRWLFKTPQGRKLVARLAGYPVQETLGTTFPPTVRPAPTMEQELETAEAGSFVKPTGEAEMQVTATIVLDELTQPVGGGSWRSKGHEPLGVVVLANGDWILKIPEREGGEYQWFRATDVQQANLGSFFRGTDAQPGPAKEFKLNGQRRPVAFQLPGDHTQWEVVDLGAFSAEIEGDLDVVHSGDRFHFVTGHEDGDGKILLYLDARPGEARGHSLLLIGVPFEPEVDIAMML